MNTTADIKDPVMDSTDEINFIDIFNLEEIQRLQDVFSDAAGVASIITHPDGSPITKPSNFCRLCNDIIRKTEKGIANCYQSDAILGRISTSGAVVQPCLSGGLWDAGAGIHIGGKNIANWLIGQVRNEKLDENEMVSYADEIGANRIDFLAALNEVPVMSFEQFNKVAKMLFVLANELSVKGYITLQLKSKDGTLGKAIDENKWFNMRIVEIAHEGIWALDSNYNTTFINGKMAGMLGYTVEEVMGKKMTDFIFSEDRQDHMEKRSQRMGGKSGFYERRFKQKSGAAIWTIVSSTALMDRNGNFMGSLGMIQDMTEQKQSEILLRQSEERFRLIAENTSDTIAVLDLDLNFIYCSPSVVKILGYTNEEMLLLKPVQLLTPESFKKVNELLSKILPVEMAGTSSTSNYPTVELEEYQKNGTTRWVELSFSFIRDQNNRPTSIVTVTRDITEHRQNAEKFQKIGHHFQAIIENAPDGIVLISLEGKYKFVSPAARKMFGFGVSEELPGNPAEYTHPDDLNMVLSELTKLIQDPSYVPTLQYRFRDNYGNWRWVESTMRNLLNDQAVESIVINFRDIHERKLAEQKINELNNVLDQRVKLRTLELETANKELETFSYSISHDLQAPLRHITGFIGLFLEKKSTELSEEELGYLKKITDSAGEMGQLINAILSFSRLNQTELRKTMIHSSEMVQQVIRFFEPELQRRKINFLVGQLPDILGDEKLMHQVWTNLISNAIKYTGKTPESVVEIGSNSTDKETTFFVKDNGAGFNMKYAEKLFGVFQRLHKSRDFEGVGIGLANVNRIVKRHGGQCRAEGEPDKGATFYFSIPN